MSYNTNITNTGAGLTGGPITLEGTASIAAISTPGTFTNATVTINDLGQVTSASSGTAPVTSVSGTPNEITVSGTTAVTISIANTYAGQTSITTLGTISTGTWDGTTIGVAHGGTGQTSFTNGELLIGNSTGNTLTPATLTAGSGVSISNGSGSITISATGSGGTVTSLSAGTGITLTPNPITTTGSIAVTASGVTAGTYSFPINMAVNAQGQITAVTSDGYDSGTSGNMFIGTNAGTASPPYTLNLGIGPNALSSVGGAAGGNTAIGFNALQSLSGGGGQNVAIGTNAGSNLTSGSDNVLIGWDVASGSTSLQYCTALGTQITFASGVQESTGIGFQVYVGASNSLILGGGEFVGIGISAPSQLLNVADGNTLLQQTSTTALQVATSPPGSVNTFTVDTSTPSVTIGGINSTSALVVKNSTPANIFLVDNSTPSVTIGGVNSTTAFVVNSSTPTAIFTVDNSTPAIKCGAHVGVNQSTPAYSMDLANISSQCGLRLAASTNIPTTPGNTNDIIVYNSAGTPKWLDTSGVSHTFGGSGTVTSVSGTANQINVATGTTTPVLSLSSTIVTPGTLTVDTTSTTAFVVESATPTAYFTVDTSTPAITASCNTSIVGLGTVSIYAAGGATAGTLTLDGSSANAAGTVNIRGGNTSTTPLTNNILFLSGGGSNGGTLDIQGGSSSTQTNNVITFHSSSDPGVVTLYGTTTFQNTSTTALVVNSATPTTYFTVDTSTPLITAACNTDIYGLGTIGIYASTASGTAGTLNLGGNSTTGSGGINIQGGNNATSPLTNNRINIFGGGSNGGVVTIEGSNGTTGGTVSILGGNASTTPLSNNFTLVAAGGSNGGTLALEGGTSSTQANNAINLNTLSAPGVTTMYGSTTMTINNTSPVTINGTVNGSASLTNAFLVIKNTESTGAYGARIYMYHADGDYAFINVGTGGSLGIVPYSGANFTVGASGTNVGFNPNVNGCADTCIVYEFTITGITTANTSYTASYPSGFSLTNVRFIQAGMYQDLGGTFYFIVPNHFSNSNQLYTTYATATSIVVQTGPSWNATPATAYVWVWFN